MADESWTEYFEKLALRLVEYAAHNPKDFLMYCKLFPSFSLQDNLYLPLIMKSLARSLHNL